MTVTHLTVGMVLACLVYVAAVAGWDAWQDWRYARRYGIRWTYHCRYRHRGI